MKITNVESRDVYVGFELSLKEIERVLDYLTHAKIKYNSKNEPIDVNEASDIYVREKFYEELRKVYEHVKENKE